MWSEPVSVARCYFALQAVAGTVWWIAVFASEQVKEATLGSWEPSLLVGPDLVLFVGASALAALTRWRVAAVVAATWTTAVSVVLAVYGLAERAAGWGVVLMAVAAICSLAAAATMWWGRLPTRWFFVGPFSFREAADASGGRHLRDSLLQLVVFWSTFFVVIPLALATIERRLGLQWTSLGSGPWRAVAVVAFVVASGLGLWSCITMATIGNGTPLPARTASDLVIAGPYRWVRNPMAVAGAIQTAAVGLWFGSWIVIAVALVGAVLWNTLIRPEEEADLGARFGAPYRRYTEQVRCWIPSRPYSGS